VYWYVRFEFMYVTTLVFIRREEAEEEENALTFHHVNSCTFTIAVPLNF
jgi:hypothetical protein